MKSGYLLGLVLSIGVLVTCSEDNPAGPEMVPEDTLSFGFSLYNITDYRWESLKSFTCEDESHSLKIELWDLD